MIRAPTEYEARDLLLSSGIKFEDRGHYFSMKCPFHKNGMEKSPSAALYKSNWFMKCFTCGEGRSFSKLYEELTGKRWTEHSNISLTGKYEVSKNSFEKERAIYEITEGIISSVHENHKALAYCRSRHISDSFLKEFEIMCTDLCKFSNDVIWKDRLLIPVKHSNAPYSLEGRDYTREQFVKCLYPKGSPIDICFNQENLNINEPLVVCEGLTDIPQIWEHFTKNVTVTFGVGTTKTQKEFLSNCKNVILFIDDDEPGREAVSSLEAVTNNDFKVAVVRGKDPGDATLKEIENALKNAVHYCDFFIKEYGFFEEKKVTLM